jgi:hypothetical protein
MTMVISDCKVSESIDGEAIGVKKIFAGIGIQNPHK